MGLHTPFDGISIGDRPLEERFQPIGVSDAGHAGHVLIPLLLELDVDLHLGEGPIDEHLSPNVGDLVLARLGQDAVEPALDRNLHPPAFHPAAGGPPGTIRFPELGAVYPAEIDPALVVHPAEGPADHPDRLAPLLGDEQVRPGAGNHPLSAGLLQIGRVDPDPVDDLALLVQADPIDDVDDVPFVGVGPAFHLQAGGGDRRPGALRAEQGHLAGLHEGQVPFLVLVHQDLVADQAGHPLLVDLVDAPDSGAPFAIRKVPLHLPVPIGDQPVPRLHPLDAELPGAERFRQIQRPRRLAVAVDVNLPADDPDLQAILPLRAGPHRAHPAAGPGAREIPLAQGQDLRGHSSDEHLHRRLEQIPQGLAKLLGGHLVRVPNQVHQAGQEEAVCRREDSPENGPHLVEEGHPVLALGEVGPEAVDHLLVEIPHETGEAGVEVGHQLGKLVAVGVAEGLLKHLGHLLEGDPVLVGQVLEQGDDRVVEVGDHLGQRPDPAAHHLVRVEDDVQGSEQPLEVGPVPVVDEGRVEIHPVAFGVAGPQIGPEFPELILVFPCMILAPAAAVQHLPRVSGHPGVGIVLPGGVPGDPDRLPIGPGHQESRLDGVLHHHPIARSPLDKNQDLGVFDAVVPDRPPLAPDDHVVVPAGGDVGLVIVGVEGGVPVEAVISRVEIGDRAGPVVETLSGLRASGDDVL